MKYKFELFPHTADIGILAYGKTLEEGFEAAAYAMFSIIVKDIEKVKRYKRFRVELKGEDLEELLVNYLSELLAIFNLQGYLLSEFRITSLNLPNLKAEVRGEEYSQRRHTLRHEIKTVTYHSLNIENLKDGTWRIRVIFDI
jgi:SHS2 domain-containing protein